MKDKYYLEDQDFFRYLQLRACLNKRIKLKEDCDADLIDIMVDDSTENELLDSTQVYKHSIKVPHFILNLNWKKKQISLFLERIG